MAVKFIEPGGDADFLVGTTNGFWKGSSSINGVGTPTIATDFVHGGHVKSIKYAPNAVSYPAVSCLTQAGTRMSCYIYLVALPSSTATIWRSHTSFGVDSDIFSVRITSGGVLQLWSERGAGVQMGSNGSTLTTGRWYRISLAYTITSTTVNRFEFFVDGVSSISSTNATLPFVGTLNWFIGNISGNSTLDFRSSDHYVDDSNSLTDPGNIWVTAKRPNANGTTNGFTTQIGAGGSGYGTGHSPQVNERSLSTTNGWSMPGAGAAVTEEYNIEGRGTGDIDITYSNIVDWMGWVSVSSLASETINIILNGANVAQAITSTVTMYKIIKGSTTYPAGTGADIGIQTDTSLTTVSLYELGVLVAYTPPASPSVSDSITVSEGIYIAVLTSPRYWVGGTANWDAATTTNWSTSSGGAGGASVPTSANDVIFDSASNATAYTCTVTASSTCKKLILKNPASGALTFAGSGALDIGSHFWILSTITRTYTGLVTFSSVLTGNTINTNGITLASNLTFDGVGGNWVLQDNLNNGSSSISLTNGSFNTNSKSVTAANFLSNNSNVRTLTLGSSTIALSGAWTVISTNLTFSGASSTINVDSNSGNGFSGDGLTYGTVTVTVTSASGPTISGTNTFSTLTITGKNGTCELQISANQTVSGTLTINGNSAANRLFLTAGDGSGGQTLGTSKTLSAGTIVTKWVDWQDITAAGAANWNLTAQAVDSSGDCGGNSGITFTTPSTQTWSGTSGGNWSANAWTTRIPLIQDTAVVNAAFSASQTITLNMCRYGTINFGCTGSPTLANGGDIEKRVYGSLNTTGLGTTSFTNYGLYMSSRSASTLTSGGFSWASAPAFHFNTFGSTCTLQDAFVAYRIQLDKGTLNTNGMAVTAQAFSSLSGETRTLSLGASVFSVTDADGINNCWAVTASGLTITPATSTIKITTTSSSATTFYGGGMTYNNLEIARGTSTGSTTIAGDNTFNDFKDSGTGAHSILFTEGTTQTVSSFTVSGTSPNQISIDSTTTGTHSIVMVGSGVNNCRWLNIQHSVVTANKFFADPNSTNNQGTVSAGSGWIFNALGIKSPNLNSSWGLRIT